MNNCKWWILAVFAQLGFFACTKEPQDIETVQPLTDLYFSSLDTIAPEYVVYREDSFKTSGSNTAIIGEVNDPVFGIVHAGNFSRVKRPTEGISSIGASNEYYDSLVLIMHADSTYYGDTLSNWTVNVYALVQPFDVSINNRYNTATLSVSEDILGQQTVRFRPNVDDSVRILLSNHFGNELFELFRNKDPKIQTDDAFRDYFKGIKIDGAPGSNAIYRFPVSDSTLLIRLYYHEDEGASIQKFVDFPIEGGTYQFNQLSCEISSTELAMLTPGAEINSRDLQNRIYVNEIAGVNTKMTFPSSAVLATLSNFVSLYKANLTIRPISQSYDKFGLPVFMGISMYTEALPTPTSLKTADNQMVQSGNLLIDNLDPAQTNYSYDISSIVRSSITATVTTAYTAFFNPDPTATTGFSFFRLVAADNRHPTQPSQLVTESLFFKK